MGDESASDKPGNLDAKGRDIDKCAELLSAGVPFRTAMLQTGFSEHQAKMGKRGLPKSVVSALTKRGGNLEALGREIMGDPRKAEAIVMGRLALNTVQGKDSGVLSAKQIGQHKALNLWASENQYGLQVNINLLDSLESPDTSTVITPLESDD